jgi:hypothetical protein
MTQTDPTFYQRRIAERTTDADSRHIEAWMRLQHPTLDALSAAEFARESEEAAALVRAAGTTECEALAPSVRPVAGEHR